MLGPLVSFPGGRYRKDEVQNWQYTGREGCWVMDELPWGEHLAFILVGISISQVLQKWYVSEIEKSLSMAAQVYTLGCLSMETPRGNCIKKAPKLCLFLVSSLSDLIS